MGSDISNRKLAFLTLGVMGVIALGFFIEINKFGEIGITGRAQQDTGLVNLTVNTTASLYFAINAINWGTGSVNVTGGYSSCTLDTYNSVQQYNCIGFSAVNRPLVIVNNGNKNLTVTLNSTVTAAQLFGGSLGGGPLFQWNITNNGTNTCFVQDQYYLWANMTNVNNSGATNGATLICGDMQWQAPNNSININIRARFVSDSLGGIRNGTLTAVGAIM